MSDVRFLTYLDIRRYNHDGDTDLPRGAFGVLLREFHVLVDGVAYTVPAGFPTDLASIPRRLRCIVSIDRGVEAAVVHDWLYNQRLGTREEADLVFKKILEATEGAATVALMYNSVRVFGGGPWSEGEPWTP